MPKKFARRARSASGSDRDRIQSAFQPLFPHCQDVDWIVRLSTAEGPPHRQKTLELQILTLIELLQELCGLTNSPLEPYDGEAYEIELHRHPHHHHLPPHRHGSPHHHASYPVDLPVGLLKRQYGGDVQLVDEAVEFLIDGPPHEVMANIVIQHLLEGIAKKMLLLQANSERTVAFSDNASPTQP